MIEQDASGSGSKDARNYMCLTGTMSSLQIPHLAERSDASDVELRIILGENRRGIDGCACMSLGPEVVWSRTSRQQ